MAIIDHSNREGRGAGFIPQPGLQPGSGWRKVRRLKRLRKSSKRPLPSGRGSESPLCGFSGLPSRDREGAVGPNVFPRPLKPPLRPEGRATRLHERGGALLSVLWLSAALAAISLSVASSVRSETDRVSSAADGLRAHYLATGSVDRAMQWMAWGPVYAPLFWQRNKYRLNFSYETGDAVVELIPESAKLNINSASEEDLVRLITVVSGDAFKAQEIAAAIVDWRSPGTPGLFDAFYASIAPTFHARHASFQEIEELLLVRGMTPELFYGNYVADAEGRLYASGGLRDCLSVWGGSGPFDANFASPALMQAVGVPAEGAAAIAARRQAAPFSNMGDVTKLGYPTPRLTVGGGNYIFTLRATARLRRADGRPSDTMRSAAATVRLMDNSAYIYDPIHVLRWYDDAWSQSGVVPQ